MKKTALTVYKKIGASITQDIEGAFYKAVFLKLSNHLENAVYCIVFDLPDAPCYRSFCDSRIEQEIVRCYGALPKKHKEKLFIALRPRRYNVNKSKIDAFSCENGFSGALSSLLNGSMDFPFTLGRIPKDIDIVYFSGSDGMIEAGGINALIRETEFTEKNIFPLIKSSGDVHSVLKKEKNGCFSGLEGLYIKKNLVAGSDKPKQEGCRLIRSVFVLDLPQNVFSGKGTLAFRRRSEYPRAVYRAFLATSRSFLRQFENSFAQTEGAQAAAYTLCALIIMKIFGTLGRRETIEGSAILFDILEQALYTEDGKSYAGKLLFLLTLLKDLYTSLSATDSLFFPLTLQADCLISLISQSISTDIAYNDDTFLYLCHYNQLPEIGSVYQMPSLLQACLSITEADVYRFIANGIDDLETALCVMIAATNVCFDTNFKEMLFKNPIFLARSSFLARIQPWREDKKDTACSKTHKNQCDAPLRTLLLQSSLSSVRSRFFEHGIDQALIPYAAYLESVLRHFYIQDNKTKVIICYNITHNSFLLKNLFEVSPMFKDIQLRFAFNNEYLFKKAQELYPGRKTSVLVTDIRSHEKSEKDSAIILTVSRDTTLPKLIQKTKELLDLRDRS